MLVRLTNRRCLPATLAGSRTRRGRARGTFTMATSLVRPNASGPLSRTMKFSALFATCGNGCAGSSPSGISSGRTSARKYSRTQRRCAFERSPCDTIRMPWRANAGTRDLL
ncbi:hypothetical protein D3C71_1451330 [compost metagenome]